MMKRKNKSYMEKEIWKDVEGYEGLYQVSNFGYIKSLDRIREVTNNGKKYIKKIKGKELKNAFHNGYLTVGLVKDGKTKTKYVHRLVAKAFIDNPNKNNVVNHIDEDKSNNYYKNLEWCTQEYNNNYGTKMDKIRIPVIQYDLSYNFIKRWNCAEEIEKELLIDANSIRNCCRLNGKSAGGYIWKYE